MTIEDNVLLSFKPFMLGYCNCGCGKNLKNLINKQGKVIQYIQYHNIKELRYYGPGHHNFNNYQTESKKYRIVFNPIHPNSDKYGRMYEHVLIMSQMLCRPLKKGEVVHHINGNGKDNRRENLQLFSSNGEHISATVRTDYSDRKCSECGSTTTYFRKDSGVYVWAFPDGYGTGRILCRSCNRKRLRRLYGNN